MHESVKEQSTAILQRAGEERRCTEMKRRRRRVANAVLSTGAEVRLAKCTTGDARGQREEGGRGRGGQGECKDYMSNWLHLDFCLIRPVRKLHFAFLSLGQQAGGELHIPK